jgi:hypothetical protein
MEPFSFCVASDNGNYVNFFAESQKDAESWVRAISHNLELSAKISSSSGRPGSLAPVKEEAGEAV